MPYKWSSNSTNPKATAVDIVVDTSGPIRFWWCCAIDEDHWIDEEVGYIEFPGLARGMFLTISIPGYLGIRTFWQFSAEHGRGPGTGTNVKLPRTT